MFDAIIRGMIIRRSRERKGEEEEKNAQIQKAYQSFTHILYSKVMMMMMIILLLSYLFSNSVNEYDVKSLETERLSFLYQQSKFGFFFLLQI